jgi:hypothetical protein
MSGATFPLPQYAFMAWAQLKQGTGTTLHLPLHLLFARNMQVIVVSDFVITE